MPKPRHATHDPRYTLTLWRHTLPLTRWAWVTGIPYQTLYARWRQGWTVERILLTPPPGRVPRGDLG